MKRTPAPSKEATDEKADRSVLAVERTLSILDVFIGHQGPMKLRDIEEATGLFHSVILRYMITLERQRYIHRLADGSYQLGSRVYQLGATYEQQLDLGSYLIPTLEKIAAQTGESACFFKLEHERRLCLYRRESSQTLKVGMRAGISLPLDETCTSQVLREFSQDADWRSHSADTLVRHSSGIQDPWTASMSTPVFKADNRLLGALTISGPRFRFDVLDTGTQRLLLQEAISLSERLGSDYRPALPLLGSPPNA
ncbi:IclR family transcriptional regulator [Bordetella sp. N]|uniref:IclR family transcriptional regulator n=1 Tax=Bordetella sp. N TaxID=1746199 RepID=UPI00070BCD93|nr:helix-turn-helix domain-containing protein [Bordetella sp. N]ALM83465.1 hypothetical protein ASB57_11240 [Bordetella sp. N]